MFHEKRFFSSNPNFTLLKQNLNNLKNHSGTQQELKKYLNLG